ncbi:hypothetical protein K7X08_028891 [Anisodus acutangulus]|uniref:Uncharacterized protein n=1 Tax=Anisodus acutangulus TaxID=402998 RepID=A0A9Q1QTM0_9SOLA|nr:hypothetical protein K7X08_028891 [Anisodus acutangulus]
MVIGSRRPHLNITSCRCPSVVPVGSPETKAGSQRFVTLCRSFRSFLTKKKPKKKTIQCKPEEEAETKSKHCMENTLLLYTNSYDTVTP